LVSIHLDDIAKEQQMVFLKESDTIKNALSLFAKQRISSAPVMNEAGIAQGAIDMLDLLYYATDKLNMTLKGSPKPDERQVEEFFNRQIKSLQGYSSRNPFVVLSPKKTMKKSFRSLGFPGIHRIFIGEESKIKGVLSQSKAVELIWKFRNEVSDVLKFTVRELWPEARQTKSIGSNDTLLAAFEKIRLDRVTGLAVLNQHGVLVGNISASDLKYASWNLNAAKFLDYLKSPISEFLQKKGEMGAFNLEPVVAKLDDHLESVVKKFVETKVHRIYIIDEFKKPLQVISLTDVIGQFGFYDVLKGTRA